MCRHLMVMTRFEDHGSHCFWVYHLTLCIVCLIFTPALQDSFTHPKPVILSTENRNIWHSLPPRPTSRITQHRLIIIIKRSGSWSCSAAMSAGVRSRASRTRRSKSSGRGDGSSPVTCLPFDITTMEASSRGPFRLIAHPPPWVYLPSVA